VNLLRISQSVESTAFHVHDSHCDTTRRCPALPRRQNMQKCTFGADKLHVL